MFFLQELWYICYATTHTFFQISMLFSRFFLIYVSMHILPYYRQISQGRKFDRRSARLIQRRALRNLVPI